MIEGLCILLVSSKHSHHSSPVVLYPNMRIVSLEGSLVLLECILAGEISGAENIQWSFNEQTLMNSGKYTIFASNNIVCIYGTCHQSQLQIRQANFNDIGTYKCSYADLLGEITVMSATSKHRATCVE